MKRLSILALLWLVPSLLAPFSSHAHSVGTSYIYLSTQTGNIDLSVRVDLHVRDVEFVLGIDENEDGSITWKELLAAQSALDAYVGSRIGVNRAGDPCAVAFDNLLVNDLSDGTYAVLIGRATCSSAGAVGISSNLMFDTDAQHRTLVNYRDRQASIGTVLSVDQRTWQAPSALAGKGRWRELGRFIGEGVHHIWIGFDHLAFLIILLLPAVIPFVRSAGSARARPVTRVLVIVSAFTLAHSITLGLAVLQLVTLPERVIEAAIAGSVIIAALANLHSRTPGPWPCHGVCVRLAARLRVCQCTGRPGSRSAGNGHRPTRF